MGLSAKNRKDIRASNRRRTPLLLLIAVLLLVGIAAFSIWRVLARPQQSLEVTPELNQIMDEWKNTPRGKRAAETMRARMHSHGNRAPSTTAGRQPASR